MLIINLIDDGRSIREVAKIANVAKGTVAKYAKLHWKICKEEFGEKHYPRKGGYWDHRKRLKK